mmetsp:Transcript_13440/g.27430  ORF Transcript_13440/g.27430 Transcript_13440/m.27430 type:complete len:89 (-) Transcript_13440:2459-2725(-)
MAGSGEMRKASEGESEVMYMNSYGENDRRLAEALSKLDDTQLGEMVQEAEQRHARLCQAEVTERERAVLLGLLPPDQPKTSTPSSSRS